MVMIAEANLPATLTAPEMSDAHFRKLAEKFDACRLEYFDGTLHLRPYADVRTGASSATVLCQIFEWWHSHERGFVTESRCGYVLPDGSRLYPNAAWIPGEESDPKFVVDILSPRDRLDVAREKMGIWIANGAELGWMIDPQRRAVTIYRPTLEPETIDSPESIRGERPVEGLVVDLQRVWEI